MCKELKTGITFILELRWLKLARNISASSSDFNRISCSIIEGHCLFPLSLLISIFIHFRLNSFSNCKRIDQWLFTNRRSIYPFSSCLNNVHGRCIYAIREELFILFYFTMHVRNGQWRREPLTLLNVKVAILEKNHLGSQALWHYLMFQYNFSNHLIKCPRTWPVWTR